MGKKFEFEIEIEQMFLITILAQEYFLYSKYLYSPETIEEDEYVQKSIHFRFIRHSLWKLLIIELSKLYCDKVGRDKFNIKKMLKKLEVNGYYSRLMTDKGLLVIWNDKLKEKQRSINNLVALRDKKYAHTDLNKDITLNELEFNELELLIDLAIEIIHTLTLNILDYECIFNPLSFNRPKFDLIKILAEEKKRRLKK